MRFEVATFNLLNLVSPGTRYYSEPPYSEAEFKEKVAWIGSRLRDSGAAIVGVQEVFQEEALSAAVKASGLFQNATVTAPGTDGKEPRVGIASTFPLASPPTSITDFPEGMRVDISGLDGPTDRFRRPPLRATVQLTEAQQLVVYVVHLKSKRPLLADDVDRDDPVEQARGQYRALAVRAAEAVALRALLVADRRSTPSPVLVLGDLNDDVDSVPLEIVAGREPPKYWPRAKRQQAWDHLFYNTSTIQALRSLRDVGYSHLRAGRHSMLDHVLVSQEFYHRNPKRIGVVENVRYLNDHLVDRARQVSGDRDRTQSDHGLVSVTLRLGR